MGGIQPRIAEQRDVFPLGRGSISLSNGSISLSNFMSAENASTTVVSFSLSYRQAALDVKNTHTLFSDTSDRVAAEGSLL